MMTRLELINFAEQCSINEIFEFKWNLGMQVVAIRVVNGWLALETKHHNSIIWDLKTTKMPTKFSTQKSSCKDDFAMHGTSLIVEYAISHGQAAEELVPDL